MGRRFLALLVLLLASACSSTREEVRAAPADEGSPPVRSADAAPAAPAAPVGPVREVRFVVTTDEHGWLEPWQDEESKKSLGGLLAFTARIEDVERQGRENVALLSTGDNWTGPYESTVLEGAPMVAAMNHLGYRVSTIGNHEFDFGAKVLGKRAAEAKFPYLAANVVDAATGSTPAWAKPFTLVEVGSVRFGVVGLANVDTPNVTDPRHLMGLEFKPYEETLRTFVPKARAAGAEQVVVLIHDRMAVATKLADVLRELHINIIGVGHAHQSGLTIDPGTTPSDTSDDLVFCNGGAYLRSYCRIDVAYAGGKLMNRAVSIQPVELAAGEEVSSPDPVIAKIVLDAKKSSELLGKEVLAKARRPITRKSGALGQLVVDSWLDALPYVDAAITNAGGIRQDVPRGPVEVRDIISVLPFNNYLLVLELTGAQLKEALENPESIAGGVRFTYRSVDGRRLIEELARGDGTRIEADDKLKVVVNDFMYRGGDKYQLKSYDPEPEETAIDWREPVLRRLRAMQEQKKALDVAADDRAREVK